jgi:hypothetical protein
MTATVKVKSSHPEHEQGFFVINESDFDKAIHELWQEPVAEDDPKSVEPSKQEHDKPSARETKMHLGSRKGWVMAKGRLKHTHPKAPIKKTVAKKLPTKAPGPPAPPPSNGLLSMLEGMGDDKSAAMAEIHLRLAQVRAFIDQAILEAEGDLKKILEALRGFLFWSSAVIRLVLAFVLGFAIMGGVISCSESVERHSYNQY